MKNLACLEEAEKKAKEWITNKRGIGAKHVILYAVESEEHRRSL